MKPKEILDFKNIVTNDNVPFKHLKINPLSICLKVGFTIMAVLIGNNIYKDQKTKRGKGIFYEKGNFLRPGRSN